MGEMTFKDAAERYGPAVALIVALVLLVTLLPGNNNAKKGSQVAATGPAADSTASGDLTTGAVGSTDQSNGAATAGQTAVGTSGSGSSTGASGGGGGATTGAAPKAATPGATVPAVVPAQQGKFACRTDGRQA